MFTAWRHGDRSRRPEDQSWISAFATHDSDEAFRGAVTAGGTGPGESVDLPTLCASTGGTFWPESRVVRHIEDRGARFTAPGARTPARRAASGAQASKYR